MNPQVRFYALHLLPLVAVAGMILALDRAGVDRQVSGWFYDAHAGEFPWRYNGFLEVVMHQWTKYLVTLIGVVSFAGYVISFISPQLRHARALLLYVTLALAVAPLSVSALKLVSPYHCPWDIAGFGGFAPYVRLFDSYPAGIAAGRCFPAGHASIGFCLFAAYFVGRALNRKTLAWAGFALGLAAGLLLGLVRIVQGAHFVSHVLWSGVVCWFVVAVLYGFVIDSHGDTQRIPSTA